MNSISFFVKFLIFFSMGIVLLGAVSWMRDRLEQGGLGERAYPHWPQWTGFFQVAAYLLDPVARRWSRSSSIVRKQLLATGHDRQFDDREFSRMQASLFLLTACVISALFTIWGVISSQGNSGVFLGRLFDIFANALFWALVAGVFAYSLVRLRLSDQSRLVHRAISAALPNFLDVLALTLESGQNFQGAVQMSLAQMSDVGQSKWLRRHLQAVIRDLRAGESRPVALQRFADRLDLPEVAQFVASIITAERQGASISSVLRRQAAQLRQARALNAERQATKAPVKLLAPLALCIFPCTFAILIFPIAVQLLNSGLAG